MKLFTKLFALFQIQPALELTSAAPYSDDEFLNVVMEQARRRTRAEQAARAAATAPPTDPSQLPAAA